MFKRKLKEESNLKAYIYLLPALIVLITFQIYPIFKALSMSFYTRYNYFQHKVFEYGLDNYRALIEDDKFRLAFKNTFIFVISVVPISIIISTFLAVLLNKNIKFRGTFKGILFLPFVTSTVAIASVWRWIFHSQYGLLNSALNMVGIESIEWLLDSRYAMLALVIMSVWKSLGYNILIIWTGLQNIDPVYYDVAKVDSAGPWNQFKNVTLPLLSPVLFFVTITSLISSFKVFSEVYALFDKRPGPVGSCLTMVYYIYDKLANQFSYGVASAASVVLFLIIMAITLIQLKIGKKFVHYK